MSGQEKRSERATECRDWNCPSRENDTNVTFEGRKDTSAPYFDGIQRNE